MSLNKKSTGQKAKPVSRRNFLKRGTAAALCAGMPLGLLNAAPANRIARPAVREFLSYYTFAPYLNSVFQICPNEGGPVWAILHRVEDQSTPAATIARASDGNCFSLRFVVPEQQAFAEGILVFRHPGLGEFYLFIAPVNAPVYLPKPMVVYEAVINRQVSPWEIQATTSTND